MRRSANKDSRSISADGKTISTNPLKLDSVALNSAAASLTWYVDCENFSHYHVNGLFDMTTSTSVTDVVVTISGTMELGGEPQNVTDWVVLPTSSVSLGQITVDDGPFHWATNGADGTFACYANIGSNSRLKVVVSVTGTAGATDKIKAYGRGYTP